MAMGMMNCWRCGIVCVTYLTLCIGSALGKSFKGYIEKFIREGLNHVFVYAFPNCVPVILYMHSVY